MSQSETLGQLLERGRLQLAEEESRRETAAREAARLACRLCDAPGWMAAHGSLKPDREGGRLELRLPGMESIPVSRRISKQPMPGGGEQDVPARCWSVGFNGEGREFDRLETAVAYAARRQQEADEVAAKAKADDPEAFGVLLLQLLIATIASPAGQRAIGAACMQWLDSQEFALSEEAQ